MCTEESLRDIYAVNYHDVSNFTKCLRIVCDLFFRDINSIKILFLIFQNCSSAYTKIIESIVFQREIKNPTAINKVVKY